MRLSLAPWNRRGLAALGLSLTLLSLGARGDTLDVQAPVPRWHTGVTGRGGAASVAWPEGSAAMTPLWVTATVTLVWQCDGGPLRQLAVKTARGPSSRASPLSTRELAAAGEGTHPVELYLWEVSQVKEACDTPGEVVVDSVPVQLSLSCQSGPPLQVERRLPLQVRCEPEVPSQEALTGLPGTERARRFRGQEAPLPKFSLHWADASPGKLRLRKAYTLEFSPVVIDQWAPEMTALRVVRLDAQGRSVESSKPAMRARREKGDVFLPRMSFTPTAPGTARFVLEAEYKDGSRLRSQPDELWVEDPAVKVALSTPHSLEGFFQEYPDWKLCSRKGVWWMRRQPWVESVSSSSGHDLSYKVKNGYTVIFSCHDGH